MRLFATIAMVVGALHLFYIYGGYVVVLRVLAALRGRSDMSDRSWPPSEAPPTVTVYIGAKNEEDIIDSRLENIIDTTFPIANLEIIVVADGCTDRTAEIAERFAERHSEVKFRLVVEPSSLGKWSAQNLAAREGWGEILISTDAETRFERETITRLTEPFSDATIGVVGGRVLYLSEGDHLGDTYNTYRGVEHNIRRYEMANGFLMKSDGPCVAYRRSLWRDIEPFEDVDHVVCYFARFEGLESIYAPSALAYDRANSGLRQDIRQRKRMTRKFFLTNRKRWNWTLRLREPGFSWAIYSHRTARLLSPFWLLVSAPGASLLLARAWPGSMRSLIIVLAIGAVAGLGISRVRNVFLAFAAAQVGFAAGVVASLGRDRSGHYVPTRQL